MQELAESSPDSEEIFEENLIDTFYPNCPSHLEKVCLLDFVANYKYIGTDEKNNRQYVQLTKPILPNHKLYNCEKEDHCDEFYYSMILLFVPFRDGSTLVNEDEKAFNRLLGNN